MNWDRVQGTWKVAKGSFRQHWAMLTDDDLDLIAGRRDQLIGTLQARYGKAREQVEREVADFELRRAEFGHPRR